MRNWKTSLFMGLAAVLPIIGNALGGPFVELGDWLGKGALIIGGIVAADAGAPKA